MQGSFVGGLIFVAVGLLIGDEFWLFDDGFVGLDEEIAMAVCVWSMAWLTAALKISHPYKQENNKNNSEILNIDLTIIPSCMIQTHYQGISKTYTQEKDWVILRFYYYSSN